MQALKEWAVVCRALEEGKQSVIFRKGGILEYRRGFEVIHNRFWLFPTFEHQSREDIKPEYRMLMDDVMNTAPDSGLNIINSYAEVSQVWEAASTPDLESLDRFHIWTQAYLSQRLRYNPSKPMSILLLRVFKSKNSITTGNKDEWSGCKSWIPLEMDGTGDPVLDDHQFNALSNELKGAVALTS
jgi:hypothetical protein